MRPVDTRLDPLLGPGADVFRAAFDLVPDPVGVWWAVRDEAGTVVDFETGYGNPAMARLFGISVEETYGHRVVQESAAYANEPAFKRARGAMETGEAAVGESVVESRQEPIGRLSGVFVHRAIPFGPDAVLNLLTDITGQRRLESELERYAQVAAHDLREPLMAFGLFVEQLASGLERGRDERNERLVELLRRTDARRRRWSTASLSTPAPARRWSASRSTRACSSPTCWTLSRLRFSTRVHPSTSVSCRRSAVTRLSSAASSRT